MKTAVLTLVSGDFYEGLAQVSTGLMDDYAQRIGAVFVIDKSPGAPGYTKLKAIRELLRSYDRVLYLDADILIRPDAPNLFDLVPEDAFGAFDESKLADRQTAKLDWERQTGMGYPDWLGYEPYYNTGVMVASRCHLKLFAPAAVEIDNFYEQTMLNHRLFDAGTKMYALPADFNRIPLAISATGRPLDDCYFSHFAGAFKNGSPVEANLREFKAQAERFERYAAVGVPKFRRRVFIETAGALGDVVSHEPMVRYVREILFPDAEITISTLWPEVFAHLVRVRPDTTQLLTGGKTVPDIGYLKVLPLPKGSPISYNQMHALDYACLHGLGGTIPHAHKRIKLDAEPSPVSVRGYVLVHAGKSWQSKTFPNAWWDAVVTGLIQNRFKVALIGKAVEDDKGVLDIGWAGCLDLRNKLTTAQLFGAVAEAPLLISNDSAPVHVSGAFNNHTIVIPTCKHPDYLVPYRAPDLTHVMGRSLQPGPIPGVASPVNMDVCDPADLLKALPEPAEVVWKAVQIRGDKTWS